MSFFSTLMEIGKQRRQKRLNLNKPSPTQTDMVRLRLEKLEKFGIKNSFEHKIAGPNKRVNNTQHNKILNRNIMLGQIERFYEGGGNLKPLQPEQRYIVSPHDDVQNLYSNAVGMSTLGVEKGLSPIRPVFKDEQQRSAFHKKVHTDLLLREIKGQTGTHEFNAMKQLGKWSSKKTAMTDFSSVSTKRSHPIVYTQGHGSPGDKNIYSETHQSVSAHQVGTLLHKMKLPKVSEVRANSCFSGTEREITNLDSNVEQHFKEQTLETHAGRWKNTFAGALQERLNSLGRRNRVSGYMGPTSQASWNPWVHKLGLGRTMQRGRGMAAVIKNYFINPNPSPHVDSYNAGYLRSQMRRRLPIKG